jgi:hypothetical protein
MKVLGMNTAHPAQTNKGNSKWLVHSSIQPPPSSFCCHALEKYHSQSENGKSKMENQKAKTENCHSSITNPKSKVSKHLPAEPGISRRISGFHLVPFVNSGARNFMVLIS